MKANDNIADDAELHPDAVPFELSTEAKITELAKLKPLDYEQRREAEAKALKVRVSFLDKMVEAERPSSARSDDEADPFDDVEPWLDPVDGAALLDELQSTILRFCVLPEHSAPLMAVWVLHAWAHDNADISPVLAFVSPEKRCGKTTALSVMGALLPRPMHNVNITTSVLFRVIEKYQPTVLIDEADTYLADNDELRGILNGGHNRLSAYVWRSTGDDHEPRRFKVWAPKCIAMIGKLPDTLEDRALVVHLRRKQDGEQVERFRADRVAAFLPLRRMAARWVADNAITLTNKDPMVPVELNDRAQDYARAICAIADAAGGHWPETVRAALLGSAEQVDDEPQSAGVLLLRDIAEVFEAKRAAGVGSTELCNALCDLEESPWPEWRGGRPITTRGIAKLLKPFGISPCRDSTSRFYRRMDFADAFNRYLSDIPEKSVSTASSVTAPPSVSKIVSKINGVTLGDGNDAYSGRDGSKRHSDMWEGEI